MVVFTAVISVDTTKFMVETVYCVLLPPCAYMLSSCAKTWAVAPSE